MTVGSLAKAYKVAFGGKPESSHYYDEDVLELVRQMVSDLLVNPDNRIFITADTLLDLTQAREVINILTKSGEALNEASLLVLEELEKAG